MTQQQAIALINSRLMGANTDWIEFFMYVIAVMVVGIMIWGLAVLFAPPNPDEPSTNKPLTYGILVVGLIMVFFGLLLIFRI